MDEADTYDVSPAYLDIRIPILNKEGNTAKVAHPFIWENTHLKAHPNGVLIYSDHKRLEFLLQWVIMWHNLIPPTPLFWVAEEKGAKSMSLHRTSLWLHSETIDWLAQTGEAFPKELHDSIMPRIEQSSKANPKPKPFTQTPGPKLARWEKRPTHATEEQPKAAPGAKDIPPKKTDDASLADQDKRYLLLQANNANMAKKPDSTHQAAEPPQTSSSSTNAPVTAVAQPKPDTSEPVNTASGPATPPASAPPASKVGAQKMLDVRTAPPPTPVAPDPKEVTPETGELSSVKVDATSDPAKPDMPGDRPQPGATFEIPMQVSPTETSDESGTAIVASSPEPAQDEDQDDLSQLDWNALADRHYEACVEVHQKTKELSRAQNKAMRLAKRMKTMQNAQGSAPFQARTPADVHMEMID